MDTIIEQITAKVETLITDSSLFLIEVKIKPVNNVKVYVDGDNGVNIDACTKLNRALYAQLEEAQVFPAGDFSLEVSSPGVDEPLRFVRQYKKNIGRTVEVTHLDDTKKLGILTQADDEAVILDVTVKEGKKKVIQQVNIPYADIKKTVVQIIF